MRNSKKFEVPVNKLRWVCNPSIFDFECTKDLAPLKEFIGQERATRAVEFGLNMKNSSYNIYVAGISGMGKTSMVKTYIEKLIKEKQKKGEKFVIQDWCYIHNFKEADRPVIVSLSKGKGKRFAAEIDELLTRAKEEVARAFSSEEYNRQKQKMAEEGQSEQQKIFQSIAEAAQKQGFSIQTTPMGPILVPMVEGRPMEEKEYFALEVPARKKLETKRDKLRKQLRDSFEKAGDMQRDLAESMQKADKEIGEYTVLKLFSPLIKEYSRNSKISEFLEGLKTYTVDHLEFFKASEEPVNPMFGVPMSQVTGGKNPYLPFQVNVFIDNSETKGPPIVIESNPNFGNLFGMIERRFLFGGYLADHMSLKAGAMSQADGGFLLVSAKDVLTNPGVWPAFKRAIKNKEVKVEDPYEQFGLMATQGMKPEPMPVNVKIALIGDGYIYQLLSMYEDDFWELFKVKADFNSELEKTKENMMHYAAFIAGCCEECETRHFEPSGVAKVLEYSTRMVSDQEKLSSSFARIKELIEESDYWASRDNSKNIAARHVLKAIDEKLFRHNLIDERMKDMIKRDTIMIDVRGAVVGQVNGLSVYSLGDISFGKPSRITTQTFLGRAGVINIERESEMSGPIHNKGVMILSGYLGWKYAQDTPLSLSASLCFEQSYSGVEGDSASSTELYAILSSLSEVPIKQNIAVTGSVNQKGEVQPIGGVNYKIEGFFQMCKAKGLTGEQGVMIPHRNLQNLMLREEVVEAVREGKFHVYEANTIDEGIEILSGVPAGEKNKDGTYPAGSINYLVDNKLKQMASKMKAFQPEEKRTGKRKGTGEKKV
ncbi:AAA family ATPase [Chloroflexota bacterium]